MGGSCFSIFGKSNIHNKLAIMINISELRIGNIVSTNRGNGIISCLRIMDKKDISHNNLPIEVTLHCGAKYNVDEIDLEPVVFDYNLLKDYGGEPRNVNLYNKIKEVECVEFVYSVNGNKCPFLLIDINGCYNHVLPSYNALECVFNPIKSLHQLQNLYFALTGKELNVKL